MKNVWIALGLAVIVVTAGAAFAREPGIAARPEFPVDKSGRVYKLDGSAPAGINVSAGERPYATIAGSRTGLGETHALALDRAGNIYVSQGGSIEVFPADPSPGSHDEAPSAFIVGANTGVSEPMGMAFDPSGRLYVADAEYKGVLVFGAHANGNVAPMATIAGSRTGFTYPQGVALDADANMFVAQFDPSGTDNAGAEILEFAAGASGNVAPIAKLAGPATQLQAPGRISIDASGNISVFSSDNAHAGLVFAPLHAGDNDGAPIATAGSTSPWLRALARIALH